MKRISAIFLAGAFLGTLFGGFVGLAIGYLGLHPSAPGTMVRVENATGSALSSIAVSTDAGSIKLGSLAAGESIAGWIPAPGDDILRVDLILPSGEHLQDGLYVSGDSCVVATASAGKIEFDTPILPCWTL